MTEPAPAAGWSATEPFTDWKPHYVNPTDEHRQLRDTLRRFVLNEPRGGVFRHVNLLVPPTLLLLGVLARMFDRTMDRPAYIIYETLNKE